jgi:hypothetical protein
MTNATKSAKRRIADHLVKTIINNLTYQITKIMRENQGKKKKQNRLEKGL